MLLLLLTELEGEVLWPGLLATTEMEGLPASHAWVPAHSAAEERLQIYKTLNQIRK